MSDQFLQLDGIKGESRDKGHKDEIDVLAWSFGGSNSGTSHRGGGGGTSRSTFTDMSVTMYMNKAVPDLMKFTANGAHIKTGILVCRKAGGKPLEYLTITMEDILVTSTSLGGSMGEEQMTCNISLNFAKFGVKYIEQLSSGGEGAKPEMAWSIEENIEM